VVDWKANVAPKGTTEKHPCGGYSPDHGLIAGNLDHEAEKLRIGCLRSAVHGLPGGKWVGESPPATKPKLGRKRKVNWAILSQGSLFAYFDIG
jgi:hypothetical protein